MNEKTLEAENLSLRAARAHRKQFTYCRTEWLMYWRERKKNHRTPIPLCRCTLRKVREEAWAKESMRGIERDGGIEEVREREISTSVKKQYKEERKTWDNGKDRNKSEAKTRSLPNADGTLILGYGPWQSNNQEGRSYHTLWTQKDGGDTTIWDFHWSSSNSLFMCKQCLSWQIAVFWYDVFTQNLKTNQ